MSTENRSEIDAHAEILLKRLSMEQLLKQVMHVHKVKLKGLRYEITKLSQDSGTPRSVTGECRNCSALQKSLETVKYVYERTIKDKDSIIDKLENELASLKRISASERKEDAHLRNHCGTSSPSKKRQCRDLSLQNSTSNQISVNLFDVTEGFMMRNTAATTSNAVVLAADTMEFADGEKTTCSKHLPEELREKPRNLDANCANSTPIVRNYAFPFSTPVYLPDEKSPCLFETDAVAETEVREIDSKPTVKQRILAGLRTHDKGNRSILTDSPSPSLIKNRSSYDCSTTDDKSPVNRNKASVDCLQLAPIVIDSDSEPSDYRKKCNPLVNRELRQTTLTQAFDSVDVLHASFGKTNHYEERRKDDDDISSESPRILGDLKMTADGKNVSVKTSQLGVSSNSCAAPVEFTVPNATKKRSPLSEVNRDVVDSYEDASRSYCLSRRDKLSSSSPEHRNRSYEEKLKKVVPVLQQSSSAISSVDIPDDSLDEELIRVSERTRDEQEVGESYVFTSSVSKKKNAERTDGEDNDIVKNDVPVPIMDDSFDRAPKQPLPHFAYVDVIRKHVDRKKLTAYDCPECKQYYKSLDLSEKEIQEKMAGCSRHRAMQAPPSTPENFWRIGFPTTQECFQKGYTKRDSQPGPSRFRRKRQLTKRFSSKSEESTNAIAAGKEKNDDNDPSALVFS